VECERPAPVSVTEPIKRERVQAYGLSAPLSTVELDHLEPVSLGGTSTVANLWPEKWFCPCGQHMTVITKPGIVSPGLVRQALQRLSCLPKGWLL